ncbi:hypothetical protein [Mesorhizobium sp. YR577]|uniref:hypothetical protein n=1 Tax=Mesorhizobium sp. YR577 TaxID=1884373 RepID=UPI0008E690E1|nr:hypothetical protein [Mesorhizobium sp. YR577]SFT59784.1 hypothetical protein SAMN05518861_102429 [Mesorhizobium sp. YR577]
MLRAQTVVPQDAYALDGLATLAEKLPLEVVLAADRADARWPGLIANPAAALKSVKSLPLGAGTEAYLCGPPGMSRPPARRLPQPGLRLAMLSTKNSSTL